MTLVKWNPGYLRRPFSSDLFEDFFNTNIPNVSWKGNFSKVPAVNVIESNDGYNIEIAAPGLKKDDFKVGVEHDTLTISVEKDLEKEETETKYTRREYGYTSFSRSFSLPDTVDADKIDAKYNDGILNITLPMKKGTNKETSRFIKIG